MCVCVYDGCICEICNTDIERFAGEDGLGIVLCSVLEELADRGAEDDVVMARRGEPCLVAVCVASGHRQHRYSEHQQQSGVHLWYTTWMNIEVRASRPSQGTVDGGAVSK